MHLVPDQSEDTFLVFLKCRCRPRSIIRARLGQVVGQERLRPARICRHDANAGRQEDRLIDTMRNEEHGFSRALPNFEQFLLEYLAHLSIQCRERLVHQQDLWIRRERPRNRHSLLHPAGQLIGIMVPKVLQADEIEILKRHVRPLGLWKLAAVKGEFDVLQYA